MSFVAGQQIYAQVKGRGWCVVTVDAVYKKEKKIDVIPVEPPCDKVSGLPFPLGHVLIPNAYDPADPDLFRVGDLHTATLLFCLKERYERGQEQYSKMGEMVLSVNPFAPMPYNAPEQRARYLEAKDAQKLPPHVWQIAEKAYLAVVARGQGNQSVVISGESGSGKTENTKAIIGYLGALSAKHSCNAMQRGIVDHVNECLSSSNPILECFGNARTVRNDNSSRFGKYIKLYFDPQSGIMVGGAMVTYLLEKSRIVRLAEGERCYHVFYEMLAGLPAAERQELGLKTAADYPCLAAGNTLHRRGVDGRNLDDAKEFQVLLKALKDMGFTPTECKAMWAVLAAVLHLQDMRFGVDANDKATIPDDTLLKLACRLLGIDPEAIKPCLLIKSKTKILTSLCTKAEAEALRDSFCKALYVGLFDVLVERVNRAIAPKVAVDQARYIGILDIFGFENFKVNSFEQLCINFANESLQNHYNKYTFVNDEAECQAEGIQVPDIQFPDNTACLQMFGMAKTGVFAVLDEQCYVRGGSAAKFTENLWEQWTKKSEYFIRPKSTTYTHFGIRHYASDVSYTTEGWLEKNSDPLKEEARTALQQTQHAERGLVGHLLDQADAAPSDGQMRKRTSVATRFQTQLQQLREELESTETHFIRCIKPNMAAAPRVCDNEHVTMQLESAGVLQTIALKRQGYPVRRKHQDFACFFHSLAPPRAIRPLIKAGNYRDACQLILSLYTKVFSWPGQRHDIGHTKVFLKAESWGQLERTLLRRNKMRLRHAQPYIRRWMRAWKKRKVEAERRKREEQMAKARAAAQAQKAAGRTTSDKVKVFEEVCLVFPNMDPTLVFDVVAQLATKDKAVQALTEMRAQEFDKHLPANLLTLMRRLEVRDAVVKALLSQGVDTLGKLYALNERQLDAAGFTAEEKGRTVEAIIHQESQAVRIERMLVSGTGGVTNDGGGAALPDLPDATAPAGRGVIDDKAEQLCSILGCRRSVAEEALRQASGDDGRAASLIMDGVVSDATVGKSVQQAPPHRAAPAAPGSRPAPQSGGSHAAPSAPRAPPSRAAPPPDIDPQWQPALEQMLALGIERATCVDALKKTNGDARRAVDLVFAA